MLVSIESAPTGFALGSGEPTTKKKIISWAMWDWGTQPFHTVITTFGENYAVCSTEFTREGSERIGRQQQTWVRFACGWRIVAAQVSLMS